MIRPSDIVTRKRWGPGESGIESGVDPKSTPSTATFDHGSELTPTRIGGAAGAAGAGRSTVFIGSTGFAGRGDSTIAGGAALTSGGGRSVGSDAASSRALSTARPAIAVVDSAMRRPLLRASDIIDPAASRIEFHRSATNEVASRIDAAVAPVADPTSGRARSTSGTPRSTSSASAAQAITPTPTVRSAFRDSSGLRSRRGARARGGALAASSREEDRPVVIPCVRIGL